MKKKFKFTLILVILTCTTIEGSHLFHRRLEGESITLQFTKAYNLIFGDDSKWKFDIYYAKYTTQPSTGSTYTVSILYNEQTKYASCTVASTSLLNCILNESNQAKTDLIQINNQQNTATIGWISLAGVYKIPINANLNYDDSYSLTYDSSSKNWGFKVKLMEKDILPENGFVTIDLNYDTSKNILAECTHNNHYLNCQFNLNKPTKFLFKISKTKISGSISWENLKSDNTKELTIPLAYKLTNYWKSYELELINGQWNYKMQARTDESITYKSTLITINSKILKKIMTLKFI